MIRTRLTYANVAATLALFIALGGTSYAAVVITGKNVKNGSLTGADLKAGSLTGTQVRNGSLSSTDLSKDARSVLKGVRGEAGAPGAAGLPGANGQSIRGPQGERGPAGFASVTFRYSDITIVSASPITATVDCLPNERPINGGGRFQSGVAGARVVNSQPNAGDNDATGWIASGAADTGSLSFQAFVVCVPR